MGQKVNPVGLRLLITRTWESKWFAEHDYAKKVHEDFVIRRFIKKRYFSAAIPAIEIDRSADAVKITIVAAKPGLIIGKQSKGLEDLRWRLWVLVNNRVADAKARKKVSVKIREIRNADGNAQLVAENIGVNLEKRVSFRRAMKKAIQSAMNQKVRGIKVICSGRLGGAEIARTEKYMEGRVPLHTLRADIDYGFHEASTTYGKIGVKVWVYHGDVNELTRTDDPQCALPRRRREPAPQQDAPRSRRRVVREGK